MAKRLTLLLLEPRGLAHIKGKTNTSARSYAKGFPPTTRSSFPVIPSNRSVHRDKILLKRPLKVYSRARDLGQSPALVARKVSPYSGDCGTLREWVGARPSRSTIRTKDRQHGSVSPMSSPPGERAFRTIWPVGCVSRLCSPEVQVQDSFRLSGVHQSAFPQVPFCN